MVVLSVSTQSAITGTYGLQAVIDDNIEIFVTDWRPYEEMRYRARFYFDPNSISMADGDEHYILYVMNRDNAAVARIAFRFSAGDYQVQAQAVNDGSAWSSSPWVTLTDGPHCLEIDWKASSAPGANNGGLTFWVDAVQQANFTTIDNDTRRVDKVELGAAVGLDTGTRGAYYFDAFESRRESYIGLANGAPQPPPFPDKPDALFADGFESGNLSAWSTSAIDGGDLSVSTQSAITGTYGMQAVIDDNNAIYVTDWRPYEETRYRARFYFDPNSISMADGNVHYILSALNRDNVAVARVQFRFSAGDYQVQAQAVNDGSAWSNTPWVTIGDGLHYLEIDWQASSAPGANNGSLAFWIDGVQQGSFTAIDNDTRRVDKVNLGAVNGVDAGTRGAYCFDAFESRRETYIGPANGAPQPLPLPEKPDALFADGFESGDLSAWSSSIIDGGDLSVSTQSAITGTYGMQAVIDDNNAIYVTDWNPYEETRYRARFYFDPNSITMVSGNAHYLFYALNRDNLVVARVELQYTSGSYQVRAAAVNDNSGWSTTAWTTISDAPHYLEFDWKASSAVGANNGALTFWVDGVQKGSFTAIDNDTRRVDKANLGAVAGIDTGTRGTYYFDAFESRRETYIGQASLFSPGRAVASHRSASKVFAVPAPVNRKPARPEAAPQAANPALPVLGGLSSAPAIPLAALEQPVTMTITYTYDPLYRLTGANYSDGTYFVYTYDAVGNRLTEGTAGGTVNVYTYDAANRLVSRDGIPYVWDANGNLLFDGVNTYTYDHANRLVAVSGQLLAASYGYNGSGDRLQQTVNSVTSYYTLDLAAGLTQVLADNDHTYLYGNGRIAQYNSTISEYFLGDALGSVRQLVDADGDVTLAKRYEPFGETLSSAGDGESAFAFTGEAFDSATGLTYLRARYYSGQQGRFISRDVWEGDYARPLSLNRWNYVESNPVNYVDHTGQIKETEEQAANQIIENLYKNYSVKVLRDYRYVTMQVLDQVLNAEARNVTTKCVQVWVPGDWELIELQTIEAGIIELAKAMNGQFPNFIGKIKAAKRNSVPGRRAWYDPGTRTLVVPKGGNPPTSVDIANGASVDKWTVAHELGHAWDHHYGWDISRGLEVYTKGKTIRRGRYHGGCDAAHRLPGCNEAGYFYGDVPAAGSDDGFDRLEDFAESVAAYVYPVVAQSRVQQFFRHQIYGNLYYSDYTQTKRWGYINGLITRVFFP